MWNNLELKLKLSIKHVLCEKKALRDRGTGLNGSIVTLMICFLFNLILLTRIGSSFLNLTMYNFLKYIFDILQYANN